MNKIEFALEDFKNIQELIKFIDQKSGFLLVIQSILVSIFVNIFDNSVLINPFLISENLDFFKSIILFLLSLSFIIILIIQIYKIIFEILLPKKAINYKNDEKSLFYYEHITRFERDEFCKTYNTLDEEKILSTILFQIYEVSKIMKAKETSYTIATKLLFMSTIILFVILIINKI